jgi:hypothetical protein
LIVLANIHVTRLLHDAVSSTVRSGVASGVGALSWIAFLPSALVFGIVSKQTGVHTASWMIVAATVGVGILLVAMAIRRRAEPGVEQPEVALEGRSSDRGHAWKPQLLDGPSTRTARYVGNFASMVKSSA